MKFIAPVFLPRIRKRTIGLVLVLLVPLLAFWLTKPARPLPPPVVALQFLNFSNAGTNPVAFFSFTNRGQTEVCLWESIQLWQLVAETPAGTITTTAPFASVAGERVLPGANKLFAVPIPAGTIRWRVSTIYGFQETHHAPSEFSGWVWRSWLVQGSPAPISDAVSWCLDLLPPCPPPTHGEVSTPLLTNLPPALPVSHVRPELFRTRENQGSGEKHSVVRLLL